MHVSWLRFVHTSQKIHKFQTFRQPLADEGSRRLPKRLKFVSLLASVYEPQSCQNYLATQDCSNVFCISTVCKERRWTRCMWGKDMYCMHRSLTHPSLRTLTYSPPENCDFLSLLLILAPSPTLLPQAFCYPLKPSLILPIPRRLVDCRHLDAPVHHQAPWL